MAIFTNSTSVALPDLDISIASNLDIAINQNPKVLAILASSATATGLVAAAEELSIVEETLVNKVANLNPYPTFATWSNRSNEPAYVVYGSHMQPIHGGILTTGSEIGQAFTGTNYTNTSQGSSSRTTAWTKATCSQQAEGNWYVRMPSSSSGGSEMNFAWGRNPDYVRSHWPFFGTIIQEEGVRPHNSIYYNGNTVSIYPRGGVAPLEAIGVNSSTYATWVGAQTGYTAISYNKRTKTLIVVEPRDLNNNYRLHVWKNANAGRDLDDANFTVGTLHFFLSEAKAAGTPTSLAQTAYYYYNDFQWQSNNSQSYEESRRKMYVIMGDNNHVGLSRFVPSNITHHASFEPNFLQTSGTLTTYNGPAATTSYGIEQGNDYGMRYMHTWDNDWFAFYSVYYYYGSGMNVIFVKASDPTKYYFGQWASTSWGAQLVPFKKDKFIMHAGDSNADGNVGMRLYTVDLGGLFKNGREPNGTARANGSTIDLFSSSAYQYSFDTRYTSTNYPIVVPMDEWTNG